MSSRRILIIGWLAVVLYAYPGYMSYDSVLQLLQAREQVYGVGHPPMMGVVWGIVDALIAGPLGMLLIQVTCFLAGAYLLLRHFMSERAAAITASAISVFPPISAVLAVIWKDSQMAAFLVLGAALLLSPRRNVRLAALGVLFLATGMRFNALAMTLPLVVLLFVWRTGMRWWQRYAIALGAWLAITATASGINGALENADPPTHLWHDSLARLDITGTLRYARDRTDEELLLDLAGTPLRATHDLQRIARERQPEEGVPEVKRRTFGSGGYTPELWLSTWHLFELPPSSLEQRAALARAWRTIVLGNLGAYATYRWHVTAERIQLGETHVPSATYVWFSDVLDIAGSVNATEHNAVPSKLQVQLHKVMLAVGTSVLFAPWLYLSVLLVAAGVVAIAWRNRAVLAVALSGIANEAALYVLAPTTDYRYSVWLVAATLFVLAMLFGKRFSRRTS